MWVPNRNFIALGSVFVSKIHPSSGPGCRTWSSLAPLRGPLGAKVDSRCSKVSQDHQNGFQKPSQKRAPKKHRKMTIVSTPECGQSILNNDKIHDFQVLGWAPYWVSFWKCFGSPNGGQGDQKATSKKHQKNDAQNEPKLVPKGVPKWTQNRQK